MWVVLLHQQQIAEQKGMYIKVLPYKAANVGFASAAVAAFSDLCKIWK